jgi:dihydroflavonol-4-reductase
MGSVFLALFRRRLPALIDGGFDWVDVRDVASSMLAAETQGRRGENYLLPGHHLSLPELAAVAEQVSGVPKPTFSVPMRFARLWSPLADMVSRRSANPLWYTTESLHALRFDPAVSGAKAQAELGHRPRPFDDTARDIHHWFTDQGLLP